MICVIARYPGIIKSRNKKFKLFEKGFKDKTLYYLCDLKQVINEFVKDDNVLLV